MKDNLWDTIKNEVELRIKAEPSLSSFLTNLVLNQESITTSLASIIASKLHSDALSCLLYTSPSPRDGLLSRMPSSA